MLKLELETWTLVRKFQMFLAMASCGWITAVKAWAAKLEAESFVQLQVGLKIIGL